MTDIKLNKRNQKAFRFPDELFGAALLLPLLVWILAIMGYPLIATVWLSLTNQTVPASPAVFIGIENYKRILSEPDFLNALKNSINWTIGNTIVQVLLGYTVALLLNYPLRRSRFAQTMSIMPWVIPTITMALTWRWMLDATNGVLGYILRSLHLVQQAPNLLGSLGTSMPTLIVLNSWRWFPFLVVIILAALQNIPQEEYDAATLDGASFIRQFFDISFPYLTPTLLVIGLLGTLLAFNVFDLIYLITRGGPVTSTTTLPILVYKTAFEANRMGIASAYAVLTFIVMALFAAIYIYGGGITRWFKYLFGREASQEHL